MASNMILHSGGRQVSFEELETFVAPDPTKTWFPVRHMDVLNVACNALNDMDFRIDRLACAVARENQRFFATIDLKTRIDRGVSLSVGIRSSTDKSFPLGFVAGSRVFVCDNLSFAGELSVRHKHTRHGSDRWQDGIIDSILGLSDFVKDEQERIAVLRGLRLSTTQADHAILQAMRREMITTTEVAKVAREWDVPEHPEFEPRTAWSLFNAFTGVLKPAHVRNFNRFTQTTSQLYNHLVNVAVN